MHKRVEELAKQADEYLLEKVQEENRSSWAQVFAELIVEECRYVMDCNKGSDQNPAWNQALSETSEKIKQHFGVEE